MIHLDISQLLADPRRSGIQRAERELIRHWPGSVPLHPCLYDPESHRMRALPSRLLEEVCADAGPGGLVAELARLRPFIKPGAVVDPERLLTAELFLDPGRSQFYHDRTKRSYWLVYDFLPWLKPDWFGVGSAARLMPYIRALRRVSDLAFISERTRSDCSDRILRRPQAGPVIPMGADGLGLERQTFEPRRRAFVMLGTIEPRKNAAAAMRAFQHLWQNGVDAELVMIGIVGTDASDERALLASMAGERRFRHVQDLPDAGVRDLLRDARALLFPSQGEGYGIPPMEALHSGIPVVVAADLPALENREIPGCIRLPAVTPEGIASAVHALLDEHAAQRLWDDAARAVVPGWKVFAESVAAWVES